MRPVTSGGIAASGSNSRNGFAMANRTAVITIAAPRLASARTVKIAFWICDSSCWRTTRRSAYSGRSWCSIPAEPFDSAISRSSRVSALSSESSK